MHVLCIIVRYRLNYPDISLSLSILKIETVDFHWSVLQLTPVPLSPRLFRQLRRKNLPGFGRLERHLVACSRIHFQK